MEVVFLDERSNPLLDSGKLGRVLLVKNELDGSLLGDLGNNQSSIKPVLFESIFEPLAGRQLHNVEKLCRTKGLNKLCSGCAAFVHNRYFRIACRNSRS